MPTAVRFTIEVLVPADLAPEFVKAMTGRDDDIVLAAERAMRALVRGDDESIELSVLDEREVRAELAARFACGCGASTAGECCAAREGYFTSLGQRSDYELRSLFEGDECVAAGRLLAERKARPCAEYADTE